MAIFEHFACLWFSEVDKKIVLIVYSVDWQCTRSSWARSTKEQQPILSGLSGPTWTLPGSDGSCLKMTVGKLPCENSSTFASFFLFFLDDEERNKGSSSCCKWSFSVQSFTYFSSFNMRVCSPFWRVNDFLFLHRRRKKCGFLFSHQWKSMLQREESGFITATRVRSSTVAFPRIFTINYWRTACLSESTGISTSLVTKIAKMQLVWKLKERGKGFCFLFA